MKRLMWLPIAVLCATVHADSITTYWEAGVTPYVDRGATALDNVDGDITVKIVTTGIAAVNPGVLGTYPVTYNVSDSSGLAADPAIRTVIVQDTRPPVITPKGNALQWPVMTVTRGTVFVDPGATAMDSFSGARLVTAVSTVNTAVVGSYTVTYTATDGSGNAAAPIVRTVNVVAPADTMKPVITIRP